MSILSNKELKATISETIDVIERLADKVALLNGVPDVELVKDSNSVIEKLDAIYENLK